MTEEQFAIARTAALWAGSVGLGGLALLWVVRRRSLRVLVALVSLIGIAAVIAGMLGTAREMFLSGHDLAVVTWVAAVAGVVGLIVAVAAGWMIARSSRRLLDAARDFGDKGEFVGSASASPAELAGVTAELERTSDKLREARETQARLEESRRELISWVSHDLRTPLAGMRAMSEALEDGIALDPARYHQQIRREVDRMVRLVDDLFELSQIHAGLLNLHLESLDIHDLVSETLAWADPVARAGAVHLAGAVPEGLCVRGDSKELARAIGNLVMNAIRHTPPEAAVQISAQVAADRVEVSVSDSCGGITAADMERLFDVAWQGDAARTPRQGATSSGAGLGLAIVKGIVEAHDGAVSVENLAPGCRFVLSLPLEQSA